MLRFLYFTIACTALTWGLCGWASHFLMPAPTTYKISLTVGIVGGLIVALYPWGRNLTRVFLLAIWPTLVATIFFSTTGTFNFSEVSFAELLNFEFSLFWVGAVWALIVLRRRKTKIFDDPPSTTKGWQRAHSLVTSHPTYRIPTHEYDEVNSEETTINVNADKDAVVVLEDELSSELLENDSDYAEVKFDVMNASQSRKSLNSNNFATQSYKQNEFIFDSIAFGETADE